MQGQAWIALLRRIPARLQDSLALTLVTGSEIVIQDILRLEPDYVILRGRMAGSTDAGRVVVMPYDRIVNIAFTKRMTEPEVQSIFGQAQPVEGAAVAAVAAPSDASSDQAPAVPVETLAAANNDTPMDASELADVEEAPATGMTVTLKTAPPPPAPPAAPAEKPRPAVSKSVLLARLRQRLAEQKLPNSGS